MSTPRPLRVLYVEDHDDLRTLVVRSLRLHDFIAAGVSTAEAARAPIAAGLVDVLLLDLMLAPGGLSGPEFLAELRADPATRTLPVVVLTGADPEGDIVRGLAPLRPDAILFKPFEGPELRAAIRKVAARV